MRGAKAPGRAVAAGGDHLDGVLQLRPAGQIGDVAVGEILHEAVGAAAALVELGGEHDVLQPAHLVGAEGERPVGAHLDAGPAVLVVRGRHHGDRRHVEVELGEIGHRRHRHADVVHLHPGGHQAGHERELDGGGIGAEIVAGDDLRLHPHLVQQRAEAEPQRLHAHQVDLLLEEPARVVFAEAGGLHHRLRFVGLRVGLQGRLRGGEHGASRGSRRLCPSPVNSQRSRCRLRPGIAPGD